MLKLLRANAAWRILKSGAAWLGIFLVLGVVGGIIFAWSGLYSVAASRGHWPSFNLVLELGVASY